MQRWTQEQSINLEVAQECGTLICAYFSRRIGELDRSAPDQEMLAKELMARRLSWSRERDALRVHDDVGVAAFTQRAILFAKKCNDN